MNGNLKLFKPAKLDLPDREVFIKQYTDIGLDRAAVELGWEKAIRDEVWLNDEYQVNIDKDPPHGLQDMIIYHLSIKRIDKQPIHDWRDLQAIKNMLIGKTFEAVELYPNEERKHDSANQFHLWAFIKDKTDIDNKPPMFPIGWTNRFVNDISEAGAVQRPFSKANPLYVGDRVYIATYRKRYVVIDNKSQEMWAKEYFDTLDQALDFVKANEFILISEEVKPWKPL